MQRIGGNKQAPLQVGIVRAMYGQGLYGAGDAMEGTKRRLL